MGLFSRRLSGSERDEALAMVHHLQTMLAYQHLATETYNDALASVTGRRPSATGMGHRPQVELSEASLVGQYVVPAIAKKIEIFEGMAQKHRDMSGAVGPVVQKAYEEMTAAINVMLERARVQHDGFQQWVNSPTVDVDTVRLDKDERAAIDRCIKTLNDLAFKKVGLEVDEWLDIVGEAFNEVRASLGLKPMSAFTFRIWYKMGIEGHPVCFFNE